MGEVPSGPARLDVVRPARSPLGGGAAGWMRALIACGLAVALCLVGVDLARHPVLLHDAAAPLYLALLAVIAPAYVAASLLAARTAPGLGAVAGGVVTVLWVIELWAGNLGGREPLVLLAYRASIAGVLLATFVGGLLGALRHGGLGAGVAVGAWSGMLSGLVVCVIAAGVGALSLAAATADPQTLAELRRSHLSDLETYSAGEWLAAGVNHLWIGLGLGSLLGLLGGAIGLSVRRGPRAA